MKGTDIVRYLQRKYPGTFDGLRYQTVDHWIDRSGPTPQWSDSALRKAELGNFQTSNGGRIGIFVSQIIEFTMLENSSPF